AEPVPFDLLCPPPFGDALHQFTSRSFIPRIIEVDRHVRVHSGPERYGRCATRPTVAGRRYPVKAELQLDGLLLPIPNVRQEPGPVESLARRVVIEQVRRARNAIADGPRSAFGPIEVSLGRDDQPILAGVEAVESTAFLAGVGVPEP